MRYVYFTKSLQAFDIPKTVAFLKEIGVDGADLTVRPGYPIHPDNALAELPRAVKALHDEGLVIGLVTSPVTMTDPASAAAKTLFEACGKAGIPALKIGYFSYRGRFDTELAEARRRMAGFARLAARTKVRACYHTHSGNMLGANGAAMRLLLHDLDPHHVGAFMDTGHLAVGGGPMPLELDMVRSWLSLLAIKDMAWERTKHGWQSRVVPAGQGIVRWDEVARGLKECRFNGTVSLHGEYETKDLEERKRLAKEELALLKSRLSGDK
jgi:sugar phosphate isomerase/epimerase